MAYEYKGRYYPTLASQRAAILQDEYKNNPAQLQAFQTIAQQQVKPQYFRQPNVKAQQDLKTWEIAKAFEKASQPAPAPAPPPPPPAPAAPSASQAAPAANVTTQYTKKIQELQAQIAAAEKARKKPTLDWETRSKQMEKALAAQRATSTKAAEALKIQSQQELAKLTKASNLRISGLETALGGLRTELGTAGQTIQSLQGEMAAAAQKYQAGLASQQEQYQAGLASQQKQYQAGLAAQKQEYQAGLANLTANQRAFQINQARAGQGAELQIQSATPATPQPAGTSMFKRRPRVAPMQISSQANLNVPTANVLNI